jgi:N-acetylmuramoyl-L-alanine amidase
VRYRKIIITVIAGLMMLGGYRIYAAAPNSFAAFGINNGPVVLIDPGHGGIDGGAESSEGVCEKNINLAISGKIRDILEENGIKTEMTRETDCGLYTEGKGSVRSKKSEDLHARLDMSRELKPYLFVSIHLNSFRENRSVFGAQTFYTTSCDTVTAEMSRKAAEKIQALLVAYIENGNTRVAMEKNDVLIMKEASVPTVIVECGFLSNYEEAVKLNTDDYQNTLARAISDGIMSHLGVEKKTEDNSDIQIVTSE